MGPLLPTSATATEYTSKNYNLRTVFYSEDAEPRDSHVHEKSKKTFRMYPSAVNRDLVHPRKYQN